MRKVLFISTIAFCCALTASAQDDDMYFTPSKKAKQETKARYIQKQEEIARLEQEREDRIRDILDQQTYYCGSDRDVDEYNRRGNYASGKYGSTGNDASHRIIKSDSIGNDSFDLQTGDYKYPDSLETDSMIKALRNSSDYKYSQRMARFDGGRPVNVYVINNVYDPWYDDYWYYGWYGPYYRSRWYWGWYGPGWYDPWYYGPGWCYAPWFYRPGWYGPGWYGPGYVRGGIAYTRGGTANGNYYSRRGGAGIQRGTAYSRGDRSNGSYSSSSRSYSGIQRSGGFGGESSARGYSGMSRSEGFSGNSGFGGSFGGGGFSGGSRGGGGFGGGSRGGGGFGGGRR